MNAMILAAGRGERLGDLGKERPKPLLEVGGETLIERHLKRLSVAGVTRVVVNVSYLGGEIMSSLGNESRWGQELCYSEEDAPALETGGGIINALHLLGADPFLLVNADVYTDVEFASLRCERGEGSIMLVPNPPHNPEGDFGLSSAGDATTDPPLLTYSGVAIFRPALFDGFPPGRQPLRPILDAAILRGSLTGFRYEGLWRDAGTAERLAEIRELAASRV